MDLTGHKRSEEGDIATCKGTAVQRGSGTDGGQPNKASYTSG